MARILVVDDEANTRRMLSRLLESEGHRTAEAADAAAALQAVAEEEPDLVLCDLVMPGPSGLELLRELAARAPDTPVVMMSGRATLGDAVQATKLGAFHFIEKPLRPETVLLTLGSALEVRRARQLAHRLAAEIGGAEDLVGSSAAMVELRALLRRVAPTDARVLLTGESGTGKELAAAALHAWSSRARGPFVRVNSAAIPRELIESEMFGHERGAFTGATSRRLGRFELADGGTLFLDEVADLSAEAQAKLLRVIESGEVERVGGQHATRVDVRIVAATNRDLADLAAAGRFREDLYYRLDVVPIRVPPLRERRADIPDLARHFFARLRARQGLPSPQPTAAALERLAEHDWPGNVRELLNTCERLAIFFGDRPIGAREVAAALPASGPPAAAGTSLAERLHAYERGIVQAALAAADGSVAEAARRLDTDRANLYRRMKRLGIER